MLIYCAGTVSLQRLDGTPYKPQDATAIKDLIASARRWQAKRAKSYTVETRAPYTSGPGATVQTQAISVYFFNTKKEGENLF